MDDRALFPRHFSFSPSPPRGSVGERVGVRGAFRTKRSAFGATRLFDALTLPSPPRGREGEIEARGRR
jgi:hypothetical protein